MRSNLSTDSRRLERVAQYQFVGIIRQRKDAIELNSASDISGQSIHFYGLTGRHAILLTAGFDDSVHFRTLLLGFRPISNLDGVPGLKSAHGDHLARNNPNQSMIANWHEFRL